MAEYYVMLDNEEASPGADNLSLTGRVNGIHCAAVVRLSQILALPERQQKAAKQRALAEAFIARQQAPTAAAGEKVML